MSRPTLEAIQTLLIIGNVLSYNMNPGVSYILLGASTFNLIAAIMGYDGDADNNRNDFTDGFVIGSPS